MPSSAASEIEVDRSCALCTSGKKHGKPRIAGVNFNMSQVNPLVVGAFSRNTSAVLGVDVETLDARLFSGFARLALSNEERAFYERVAQGTPSTRICISVARGPLGRRCSGNRSRPEWCPLVRVQLTDELLDALELAMNEEVPGDWSWTVTFPAAPACADLNRFATQATFSAPQGGNQGGKAIERNFSFSGFPWHCPTRRTPSTRKDAHRPGGGEPDRGEPAG